MYFMIIKTDAENQHNVSKLQFWNTAPYYETFPYKHILRESP